MSEQAAAELERIKQAWHPWSSNVQCYGTPTRVDAGYGKPTPKPDERWIEFDDGTRAYFKKGTDGASNP